MLHCLAFVCARTKSNNLACVSPIKLVSQKLHFAALRHMYRQIVMKRWTLRASRLVAISCFVAIDIRAAVVAL